MKNDDMQKFFQAIQLTEAKYGKGSTRWITYLYHNDIQCFTSSNGARDLVTSLDTKVLQKKVMKQMFYYLASYLKQDNTITNNDAANYIIKWFDVEIRKVKNLNMDYLKWYDHFSTLLSTLDSLFQNDVIFDVLVGNFKRSNDSIEQFSNVAIIFTMLSNLSKISLDSSKLNMVIPKMKNDVLLEDFPLDDDLAKFIYAVRMTIQKSSSEKRKVQVFNYLKDGDLNFFLSTDGVRELMKDINYQKLRLEVFVCIFENILSYFSKVVPYQKSTNKVVGHLVDCILWEFDSSEDLEAIFEEAMSNFISNAEQNREMASEAFEILLGNIIVDSKSPLKTDLEVQRKLLCGCLSELISFGNEKLEFGDFRLK